MTMLGRDLRFMLTAAEDAIVILGDATASDLEHNREKGAALCYLIIAAGETASHISKRGEADRYPDSGIDWAGLISMRNVLAHNPQNVRMLRVRQVVAGRFPALIAAINAILPTLPSS